MDRNISDVDIPRVQALQREYDNQAAASSLDETIPRVSAFTVQEKGSNSDEYVKKSTEWSSDHTRDGVEPQMVTPPGGGGGHCYCIIDIQKCESLDWSCLVTYATAGIGAAIGTASCIASGAVGSLACAGFVNSLVSAGNSSLFSCGDLADNCHPSTKCISERSRRHHCETFP